MGRPRPERPELTTMPDSLPVAYVLNGPNLNLLGERETELYGRLTLPEIETLCRKRAETLGMELEFRQTNHEGTLVDWIQEASKRALGVALNAGGYSHDSIALLDAVRACACPVIEVHLSNIHAREDYRQTTRIGAAARGAIIGLGADGYVYALDAIYHQSGTGQEHK